MSSSFDQELRQRRSLGASVPPPTPSPEKTAATAAPHREHDSWTWDEFRQLCARTAAILVVFTALHMVLQAYVLDPLAGKRAPLTEDEIRRFATSKL